MKQKLSYIDSVHRDGRIWNLSVMVLLLAFPVTVAFLFGVTPDWGALVLGLVFNNLGFVGLLPVIANLQYSLCVFRYRDNERALKISFVFCTVAFSIFNAVIQNYVGTVSNLVVMVTLILYLVKNRKPAES